MTKLSPRRLQAAKERILSRYEDRDKVEADMMVESFKGKTSEQIKEDFEKATGIRELELKAEKFDQIVNCLHGDNLCLSGWHLNSDLQSVDELFEEKGWV